MGIFDFLSGPPNIEELKAKKDVEGLIKALQYKKDWRIQRQAAEALGKIKDIRAVESLIQALKDDDMHVREKAAEALGRIGDKRATELLIRAREEDEDYDVRIDATEALGRIGDKRAIEPLIQDLNDKSNSIEVRFGAAWALGKIGEVGPLIEFLNHDNPSVSQAAAYAFREMGEPSVEPLIQALKNKTISVVRATWALEKVGKPAVKPLIKALKDEDAIVRRGAAEVLGKLEDKRAVEPLTQALKDEDSGVQWIVRKSLQRIKKT